MTRINNNEWFPQKNVRQNFGNCKNDYPSFSNLYSSVFSVDVTFGKPNSGTVVSEGQDVLVHFQLRGIYRAPNKMSFFSQSITLALRHHIALSRPSTCFISTRRFLILANRAQIEFSDPLQGGCSRGL